MDNLYSVIYVGDSNVTVGKAFHIQCLSKVPIEWHKDERPIQEHFVRHSKDEFNYEQHDVSKDNDMIESTLSVNHALLRHSGKYKCNIHHQNSHVLYVNENTESIEMSVFEKHDEDDHLEVRVSYEPPVQDNELVKSTMMIFVEEITETNGLNFDDYEGIYSGGLDEETTTALTSLPKETEINKIPLILIEETKPSTTTEPITTTQKLSMIISKGSHESHELEHLLYFNFFCFVFMI